MYIIIINFYKCCVKKCNSQIFLFFSNSFIFNETNYCSNNRHLNTIVAILRNVNSCSGKVE